MSLDGLLVLRKVLDAKVQPKLCCVTAGEVVTKRAKVKRCARVTPSFEDVLAQIVEGRG